MSSHDRSWFLAGGCQSQTVSEDLMNQTIGLRPDSSLRGSRGRCLESTSRVNTATQSVVCIVLRHHTITLWSSTRKGLRGYFFDTPSHTSKLSPPSTPPWLITTTGTPPVGELSKYVGSPRSYLSFTQHSPYLQFQLGAPPLPTYQPLPTCMYATPSENWRPQNSYLSHTGTGLDFYSAHAMGGDPYVIGCIIKEQILRDAQFVLPKCHFTSLIRVRRSWET